MDTILKEVLRIEHKRDWLDLTMGFHAFVVFGALNSLITRKFYFYTDIDKVRNLLKIYFYCIASGRDEERKELIYVFGMHADTICLLSSTSSAFFLDLISMAEDTLTLRLPK